MVWSYYIKIFHFLYLIFDQGYYQLTIKDNQFTFNLFDKKFTKLTTIIGTREIEKPQLTFFQQFGMPIVAGIVIICKFNYQIIFFVKFLTLLL